MDFFDSQQGVDQYLLNAAQQIAAEAIAITRKDVLSVLLPVFSTVHIESINALAFTMPSIRPAQDHAARELALHYTPDTIKFELQVSIIQKHESTAGIEDGVKKIVHRWLNDKFEHIEISATRLLSR